MRAAGKDETLTGLWFTDQKHYPAHLFDTKNSTYITDRNYPLFKKAENWLALYFSGCIPVPDFNLKPAGTNFQISVWARIKKIKHGSTISYKDLYPSSPRAAGSATGKNPISIIIPCHRVIGSNGALTGYDGGIERKKFLLELEGYYLFK